MFCYKCGKQVVDGAAFCHHCGANLDFLSSQNNTPDIKKEENAVDNQDTVVNPDSNNEKAANTSNNQDQPFNDFAGIISSSGEAVNPAPNPNPIPNPYPAPNPNPNPNPNPYPNQNFQETVTAIVNLKTGNLFVWNAMNTGKLSASPNGVFYENKLGGSSRSHSYDYSEILDTKLSLTTVGLDPYCGYTVTLKNGTIYTYLYSPLLSKKLKTIDAIVRSKMS